MPVLSKAQVRAPAVQKETIEVAPLGGDVVVHGIGLSDYFDILALTGNAAQANALLAIAVRDADGEPLFTAEQWNVFGLREMAAYQQLCSVARRVSGLDTEQAEKN